MRSPLYATASKLVGPAASPAACLSVTVPASATLVRFVIVAPFRVWWGALRRRRLRKFDANNLRDVLQRGLRRVHKNLNLPHFGDVLFVDNAEDVLGHRD